MSTKIEKYISILRVRNRQLEKGTRLGYNLETSSPTTIEIIVALNIYGEHLMKIAEKIANNDDKIKFLREYDFNLSRWSEPSKKRPIFYIQGISFNNEEKFQEAIDKIISAKDELYNTSIIV
ncbi:hypothetical protein LCGC14_0912850 [marine sediment metagenome]|uniref:Uncharacterized protein n=1 Tax=marine sediment metagenome TaxID=412755 RepID=A0A0F9NT03_9ZZZZ|nr:hypothetical protein [bacterium]